MKEEAQPKFLNPQAEIERHENRLPHWQQDRVTFFVTFRLGDSIPQTKLASWRDARDEWLRRHQKPWTDDQDAEYHERFSRKMEDWLDAGEGACLLRDQVMARIVGDALQHFEGKRCRQHAWVVMPNHVHTLFSLMDDVKLEALLQSWKSFTAHTINRSLARCGSLWEEDYYDRMIRNSEHFGNCVRYIRNNPGKAKLADGQYLLFEKASGSGDLSSP